MLDPQLTTFMAAAHYGSFTKAADAMFLTPTAVMKQINALEKRLDVTLFDRSKHGLCLTAAGESLLQDAKYMTEYAERAIEKARAVDGKTRRQTVRIGTSIMTPAKFLLDIWTQLQKQSAPLQIELIPFENTPENAREILRNLGNHIDVVAGIYDDGFLRERQCQAAHLSDKTLSLAVPLAHPLAAKERIAFDDLVGGKIMFITKGWSVMDAIRAELIARGVGLVDFDFFNINAFNTAVQNNVPIMAIDGWENVHPLLKIVPVDWRYKIPFGIMYSLNPAKSVKSFIAAVQAAV